MPPTQSLLTLGTGPGSVHEARRWVALCCEDLGRAELAECAQVGVSELVTNALLHAEAPIQVSVCGSADHPRIEVRDASTEAPELPDLDDTRACGEEDLPLLTFGRGLGIVARSSRAWGADIGLGGKVVWFEPAASMNEEHPPDGVITGLGPGLEAPRADTDTDEHPVVLRGVPVRLLADAMRHHRELRREARLLALAEDPDHPVAGELSEVLHVLDRPLRASKVLARPEQEQVADDLRVVDVRLRVHADLLGALHRLDELLGLADDLSRDGRLLTPARSMEQATFERWFLRDVARQVRGAEPSPWEHPDEPDEPDEPDQPGEPRA